MNHKGTITLETERLILRRYVPEDAEAMFRNSLSDPKVPIYMTWKPYEDLETVREYIASVIDGYKNSSHYHWAIVVKELNEPIGSIGVTRYNNETRCVDIGYSIGSKWWHQGYTSEALQGIVHFFFYEIGANRIEAQHDVRNPNSGKVMQKAGLRYEGTFRQSEHNNQGLHDSAHYAILAEDYFNSTKADQKPESGFWSAIDKLVSESEIVIDRPKGTTHPRFDFIYPLDYGYLENTTSMDGSGIDVWRGSLNTDSCDALICTVDLLKKDSEIKLLLSCTEEEKDIAMRFHNDSEYMKGAMIRRSDKY